MLSTTISSTLGREHARELRRDARRVNAPQAALPSGVTIRVATSADYDALERLAILDSSPTPTGHILVAEVDGELWAAVPVAGGESVADPFHPSAALVSLLALHAKQVRAGEAELSRSVGRRHLVALPGR